MKMFFISNKCFAFWATLIFSLCIFTHANAQTISCTNFTDATTITNIPNKPSTTTFDAMMGLNVKLWETPPSPFTDIASFIRTFHLMDGNDNRDFKNLFPKDFSPFACPDPIPLPLSSANCFLCGTGGYMTDIRPKYCEWKKASLTTKVVTAIEKLNFTGPFYDKNYTFDQWGNSNQAVFNNARNYGKEFAKNYCPLGSGNACFTDVVELTNEAWGIPGVSGLKAYYRGFIVGVNDYYTSTNPSITYNESSFVFPSSMNMSAWKLKLSSGAYQAYQTTPYWPNDFVGSVIPSDCWAYLESVNVHPYAFTMTTGSCPDPNQISAATFNLLSHPEGRFSQFLSLLNMVSWKNTNQPSKKLVVSEFGHDSQNVGQDAQGIYLVRALLMAGRFDVFQAAAYELKDNSTGSGLYETSGLYTSSGAQKPAYHAVKRFKSKMAGKVFLKKLNNSEYDTDNMFAYIVGNTDGSPTHLIVWRPVNINNGTNASAVALAIPNFPSQFSITASATVQKLGTEVSDVSFAYSTIQSGTNINVTGVPYMIPINAGTCKYDASGSLINCGCVTNAGAISGNESNCNAFNPANITSTTAGSGGSGTVTYSWEKSTTSATSGFSTISGANLATFDEPSTISQTTWYRRLATQAPCTVSSPTTAVSKTVSNVNNPGAVSGNENQCTSYNPALITSTSPASGGSGTPTYQWQSSTTSATSGFTDISGATATTFDPSTITTSTWYRRGARTGSCSLVHTTPAVAKTISASCCPVNASFVRSVETNNCRTYTLTLTATANASNLVVTIAGLPGNGYNSQTNSSGSFTFTAPTFVTTASWTLPTVTSGTNYTLTITYCWAAPFTCPTFSIGTNGCTISNQSANCSARVVNNGLNEDVLLEDSPQFDKILFPNPTSDVINVRLDAYLYKDVRFKIINIEGKEVLNLSETIQTSFKTIPIADLPDGSYFIIIRSEGVKDVTEKFVISR